MEGVQVDSTMYNSDIHAHCALEDPEYLDELPNISYQLHDHIIWDQQRSRKYLLSSRRIRSESDSKCSLLLSPLYT